MTTNEIDKAFDGVSPDAIGTGTDADGVPDGSDCWDHWSARFARDLTGRIGMSWDFSTWADARVLAHAALAEMIADDPNHPAWEGITDRVAADLDRGE